MPGGMSPGYRPRCRLATAHLSSANYPITCSGWLLRWPGVSHASSQIIHFMFSRLSVAGALHHIPLLWIPRCTLHRRRVQCGGIAIRRAGCDISDQDGLTRLVFLRDLCAIGERVDGASASAMTLANKAQRHAWPSKWRKLSMSGLPYISLRIKNSKQRAISEEPRKTTASRE